MKERPFSATSTCNECPWRKDVPVGRFPPERFAQLRRTVEQGFGNPIFACHKTSEGRDVTCVGYLLSEDSLNNFSVRMALAAGRVDRDALTSEAPLFETYEEMARANGARRPRRRRGGVR